MNLTKAPGLVLLLASLASGAALGGTKPLHGGIVQTVGEKSFELVAKPDATELYVVDDGEEVASDQMSATLTVDVGGTQWEFVMLPAGGNKFVTTEAKIPSRAKVAVLLIAPDQSKTTARFRIK